VRPGGLGWRRAVRRAVVSASTALLVMGATPAADPLAGIVLNDDSGRPWLLDEIRDAPVLLVIADRKASEQAKGWGERLAARSGALAPWRAPGKATWLAVADLRRVPDYARDAALESVREWTASRSEAERQRSSPLLLDWDGLLAQRFAAERGQALLVLLSPDRRRLVRVLGAPTDDALAHVIDAIAGATTR
jgi:hypothetical protein